MFGGITEKFQNVFSALASKKKLTDENISDAVREVRMALLDADVNYTVAKNFINSTAIFLFQITAKSNIVQNNQCVSGFLSIIDTFLIFFFC